MNSLTLAAKWHESQAKIFLSLSRDAKSETNAKHCKEQAETHLRWSQEIRRVAQ